MHVLERLHVRRLLRVEAEAAFIVAPAREHVVDGHWNEGGFPEQPVSDSDGEDEDDESHQAGDEIERHVGVDLEVFSARWHNQAAVSRKEEGGKPVERVHNSRSAGSSYCLLFEVCDRLDYQAYCLIGSVCSHVCLGLHLAPGADFFLQTNNHISFIIITKEKKGQ